MNRVFSGVFMLLAVSGCDRAKEAVENKAQEEIAAKVAEKVGGGAVKVGELCPNWPKNVPLYDGAKIIACTEFAAPDGGTSQTQIAEALAKREGKPVGPPPDVSKMLTVGTEVKATPEQILAFYKKSLPKYETATTNQGGGDMTAFANKSDAADKVSSVLLMPMGKGTDPGVTTSTITVFLKKD